MDESRTNFHIDLEANGSSVNINKRKLLSQLETERLQCNGNTIKQYGDAALALVKDCFFKGLDDRS